MCSHPEPPVDPTGVYLYYLAGGGHDFFPQLFFTPSPLDEKTEYMLHVFFFFFFFFFLLINFTILVHSVHPVVVGGLGRE